LTFDIDLATAWTSFLASNGATDPFALERLNLSRRSFASASLPGIL
jgi:hypothetical protein